MSRLATLGTTRTGNANLTGLMQARSSDWRQDPALNRFLSRLGIDQELRGDEDLTAGCSSCGDSDDEHETRLKTLLVPLKLFSSSESMVDFADRSPSSAWKSIPLQYYLQYDEGVMPRINGLDTERNDTRGLLAGEQKVRTGHWEFDLRAVLPRLLVIDCFSFQVIAADPTCTYVALSYVWGKDQGVGKKDGFTTDLRGRCLPQTIQDAMNVVRVLGLKYLWVDRYCINSDEPDIKHHMISNMDTIYQAAFLTIIAAAGSDGRHGLPSVSKTFAALDSDVTPPWDGVVYSEFSGPHLRQFKNSAYSTRGWTFQEDILSQRRLIFSQDRATLYYARKARVRNATGIFAHINEYSRRTLSFDSDRLKAFLGVFRAYERLQPPVKHICGLPFLLDQGGKISRPGYGLLWSPIRSCTLGRIPGMPSWTWAGWSGWSAEGGECVPQRSKLGPYIWLVDNADFAGKSQAWDPSDISLEVKVGAQLTDIGDYFRADQRQTTGENGGPEAQLYLTSWSTIVNARVSSAAVIRLLDKDLGAAEFTIDSRPELLHKGEPRVNGQWTCQWIAAVICWGVKKSHGTNLLTQSLLLERVGDGAFRRAGVLETEWHKSDLDTHGRIAALDRSFTRTRLCLK